MPDAAVRRVGAALAEDETTAARPAVCAPGGLGCSNLARAGLRRGGCPGDAAGAATDDPPPRRCSPWHARAGAPTQTPPPSPPPAPPRKLTATVASARKAKVSKAQVLAEGAMVTTEAGGGGGCACPTAQRAGLTGSSQVTLSKLEARTLALDVKQGSLALVVPHRAAEC